MKWLVDSFYDVTKASSVMEGFGKARKELSEQFKDHKFISEEDAKKILLITWFLTDPDAENTNINITKFEKWRWKPSNDVSKFHRSFAAVLFAEYKDSWMRLVNIAWGKNTIGRQKKIGDEKINESDDKNRVDQILSKLKNHPKLVPIVLLFIIISCLASFLSNWEVVMKFLSNSAHAIAVIFYEPKIDVVFADSDSKSLSILMEPNESESIDIEIAVKNYGKTNAYNVKLELLHSMKLGIGRREKSAVVGLYSLVRGDDGRELNCQEFYVGDVQGRSDPENKATPIKLVITPAKLGTLYSRTYELEIHLTADNISSIRLYKLYLTSARKASSFSFKRYFVTYKDGSYVRLKKFESEKR